MRLWAVILGMLCQIGCFAEGPLWVFEQDLVKLGKTLAFEKYKRAYLDTSPSYGKKGGLPLYALQESDSSQYFFLVPVSDYAALGRYMENKAKYRLESVTEAPYFSTINFSIESLQSYLSECSYVPKGKEKWASLSSIHYTIFSIIPGYEAVFEERLASIANAQSSEKSPYCFRTWKSILGSDTPKYIVAVFAKSAQEAEKSVEALAITKGTLSNIVRQQKEGTAVLRPDLSVYR